MVVVDTAQSMCRIVAMTTAILLTYVLADFHIERTRKFPRRAGKFPSHARKFPSRARLTPCPVDEAPLNDTEPEVARCVCTPAGDIRCHGGVRAVPKLVVEHLRHAQSTSFVGFYAAHQQIGGVPAFAFADLSVDRIVLNFNPIGHRQVDRFLEFSTALFKIYDFQRSLFLLIYTNSGQTVIMLHLDGLDDPSQDHF